MAGFSAFQGQIAFPRSVSDLARTDKCPACFTLLLSSVCSACSLDLTHPAAAELASVSADAAALLNSRVSLIGQIRFETGQTAVLSSASAPPATTPAAISPAAETQAAFTPSSTRTIFTPAVAASFDRPRTASTRAAATSDPLVTPVRRRSSIQVILLIVGVSLLAVAAIFFLVFAFINYGILGRSVIIATITVASILVASVLRMRGLASTAEGIAVLSIVLVYLDVFAIRANDFFGAASPPVALYLGWSLAVTSALFIAWNRASGLRAPNLIGFASALPAIFLFIDSVLSGAPEGARTFVACAITAISGCLHVFAPRGGNGKGRSSFSGRPERIAMLVIATISLGRAATVIVFEPSLTALGSIALSAVVALISAALVLTLDGVRAAGNRKSPAFSTIFAVGFGICTATAVGVSVHKQSIDVLSLVAPTVWAAAVALVLELAFRRCARSKHALVHGTRIAAFSAFVCAALGLFAAIGAIVLVAIQRPLIALEHPWQFSPVDHFSWHTTEGGFAAAVVIAARYGWLTAVVVGLLTLLAWWASGLLARRGVWLAWFSATVITCGIPLIGTVWIVMTAWLAVSALALAGLLSVVVRTDRRDTLTRKSLTAGQELTICKRIVPFLAPLLATLIGSAVLAYATSWATTSTWWISSVVGIALLLVSRRLGPPLQITPVIRAILLGLAVVVFLIGICAFARLVELQQAPGRAGNITSALPIVDIYFVVHAVCLAAIVVFALATVVVKAVPVDHGTKSGSIVARASRAFSFNSLDRRFLFWIGASVAASTLSASSLATASLIGQQKTAASIPWFGQNPATVTFALGILLLGVTLSWLVTTQEPTFFWERRVASIGLAPCLAVIAVSFAALLDLPQFALSVAPVTAAVLSSAGIAVLAVRQPKSQRWPRELGIAIIAVPPVIGAVSRNDVSLWLVLLLAGVAVLLLSISDDGLFASASRRRQCGWLALGFVTSALWLALGRASVDTVELYVLPLAGALLIISLLLWRMQRNRKPLTTASATAASKTAPLIALAGLLTALLPTACSAGTDHAIRAVLVFAAAAALAIVGSTVVGSPRLVPFLDAAALSGVIGVLVVTAVRCVPALGASPIDAAFVEVWLAVGVIALIVVAFGQTRERHGSTAGPRQIAGRVLGILALTLVLLTELPALGDTRFGSIRALMLLLVFCALHVIAFMVDRIPFSHMLAWVSIAYAAIAFVAGLVTSSFARVEIGAIPLAIALISTGAVTLLRHSAARSWPWLAPGISILLVPSLLATAWDAPAWRLVGLSVIAVGILILSVMLRLQAPFIIAAIVVVIHLFATFAPGIRTVYEAVEWWLWFVPLGIIVVVFAARFERSVQTVQGFARRMRALR